MILIMLNKRVISILVVLIIIFVIIIIWFVKNGEKENNQIINNNIDNTEVLVNSDFKLNTRSKIDLEKLKSHNLPIIIDFGADGCGPCKEMEPALEELNEELQGKAIIKFIDVWKYPTLANEYPIQLIPTQILFNSDGTPYAPANATELGLEFIEDENGEHIYTTHVGILTKEQMLNMLREMGLNE